MAPRETIGVAQSFNLADLFESVADACDEREALVAGDRRLTYRELDERANRLAHHLTSLGVRPGDFVGLQLVNGTEYAEGMLACFKIRAVPVNVNYRYVADELRYLFDDADLVAVITNEAFSKRVVEARTEHLEHIIVVEQDYEAALAVSSPERDFPARSSDDLYVAYTGGTTGLPKGVIWRHEDIFFSGMGGGDAMHSGNVIASPEELVSRIPDNGLVALATPPLMHVSAHWLLFSLLFGGGKMVFTPEGRFDPATIWRLVDGEAVNMLIIVGDAMARPLADEFERGNYDAPALFVIGSGGAVLSPSTKEKLIALFPNVIIADGFGSSETGTMGTHRSSGAASATRFTMSTDVAVFDEQLRPLEPGSDVIGRLGRRGHVPLRYHKDEAKTAETFVTVGGERWVLPGDYARVLDDGTIELLGRGSVSINTGGEKVYPEEVEAAIKGHPDVADAVVVGVPDERWGERVVAVIEPSGRTPTLDDIQAACREKLAGYKVPRELKLVEKIERSPSGKTDYRWAKRKAME